MVCTLARNQADHTRRYPASVTGSALLPASSGPSVESVSGAANGGVSGKVIGAAVAVPILVIAALVCAYVVWNRYKKKPEKKRWSAVRSVRSCP